MKFCRNYPLIITNIGICCMEKGRVDDEVVRLERKYNTGFGHGIPA